MKQSYNLLTVLSVTSCVTIISCNKSISAEDKAAQEQANAFQASILNHTYHLVSYYSDKPIDYNPYDNVVKSETDLNIYVLPYLWDDQYVYGADGNLQIVQGDNKIPGNSAPIINFNYKIGVKTGTVFFDYFDYYYKPMEYSLTTFNDSLFIINVPGPQGSRLFSKFLRIQK